MTTTRSTMRSEKPKPTPSGGNLLKNLLISCVALLLLSGSSCKPPPDGPLGFIGVEGCIYHDASLPEEKRDYTLSFHDCVNHIATTSDFHRRLLDAYVDCRSPGPGPMCIVGDDGLLCNDPSEDNSANVCFGRPLDKNGSCLRLHEECVNYVVTTPTYERVLREWYARRCR